MKLIIKISIVISLLVIVTGAQIFFGHQLNKTVSKLNNAWYYSEKSSEEKSKALHQIIKHFGYGGFIHHFKNLVIREDPKYISLAQKSLNNTNAVLKTYMLLDLDRIEYQAILDFKKIVQEYSIKFEIATQETSENNLTVKQLDNLVTVDDLAAFKALDTLIARVHDTDHIAESVTESYLNQIHEIISLENSIFIPFYIFVAMLGITAILQLTLAINKARSLMNCTEDALVLAKPNGRITESNKKARKLLGYSTDELHDLTIEDLIPNPYRKNHVKLRQLFEKQTKRINTFSHKRAITITSKEGKDIPVKVKVSSFTTGFGKMSSATIRDLSKEKELELKSNTDHLTKTANRQKIESDLNREISRALRYNSELSIIFTDIDYFKKINDVFGHLEGDKVLVQFSDFLSTRLRVSDTVGRWGGEEFIIICPHTDINGAANLANSIREQLALFTKEQDIIYTSSFGVTTLNKDDCKASLLDRADAALYQAKKRGRNRTFIIEGPKEHLVALNDDVITTPI